MTGQEFAQHLAMQRVERTGRQHQVQQWAWLMAAVCNGQLRRADKQAWSAADFLGSPWAPPPPPPAPPTVNSLRSFAAQMRPKGATVRKPARAPAPPRKPPTKPKG